MIRYVSTTCVSEWVCTNPGLIRNNRLTCYRMANFVIASAAFYRSFLKVVRAPIRVRFTVSVFSRHKIQLRSVSHGRHICARQYSTALRLGG